SQTTRYLNRVTVGSFHGAPTTGPLSSVYPWTPMIRKFAVVVACVEMSRHCVDTPIVVLGEPGDAMSAFSPIAPSAVAYVANVVASSASTSNTKSPVSGRYSTSDAFGEPTVVGENVVEAGMKSDGVRFP